MNSFGKIEGNTDQVRSRGFAAGDMLHWRTSPSWNNVELFKEFCPFHKWRPASVSVYLQLIEESFMNRIIAWGWAAALTVCLMAADLPAQEAEGPIDFSQVIAGARAGRMGRPAPGPFQDFNVVTQGAEKIDGLFTLHKKGDHLYAEIQPMQFNQPLLVPVTIARGMASAGTPVGDDDMVLIFRRVGDRIQLVRRNIHFKASGSGLDKSVQQNYTDSV